MQAEHWCNIDLGYIAYSIFNSYAAEEITEEWTPKNMYTDLYRLKTLSIWMYSNKEGSRPVTALSR